MIGTTRDSPARSTLRDVSPTALPRHQKLRDGTSVLIRPICDADVALERQFIERLSPQSRRYRFLGTIKSPSPAFLRQLTHPETVRGVAFIALIGEGSKQQEIGVCRYSASADGGSCECAVAVSDEWQGKGLATILMRQLIDTARQHGIKRMYSIDANDNQRMRELADQLGFERHTDPEDPVQVIHTLDLDAAKT
jgi:RimJ/RimL family protein N-acetyltransferase